MKYDLATIEAVEQMVAHTKRPEEENINYMYCSMYNLALLDVLNSLKKFKEMV